MIDKFKKILSRDWFYVLLLAVLASQVFFWFHGNNIINVADFSFMLEPITDTEKLWYRWDHTRGLGVSQDRNAASLIYTSLLVLIHFFTRNISLTEKMLFLIWFFFSGLSAFVLVRHFVRKNLAKQPALNLISLVGALFYSLNPFLYNYRWGHGFLIAMFIYSIAPLLIYYLIRIFEAKEKRVKSRYFLYFIFVNILAVPAFENPAYFLAFFMILIPLGIIYRRDIWQNKTTYLQFTLIYLLANLWWILRPLSFFESSKFMGQSAGVDNGNLRNYEFRFTSFFEVLRLQGFWATRDPNYYLFGKYYFTKPLIILAGYFLALLPWTFFLWEKGKYLKRYFVWAVTALVLIFLIKGIHDPLAAPFAWLIDNTPFRIFRFSMEKFYPILILVLSIFLALALSAVFAYRRKLGWLALALTLGAIAINAYPFFINGIIPRNEVIPNKFLKRYYSIPVDYYAGAERVKRIRLDQRNLILPDNAGSPSGSWTIYRWSSVGVDPLWNLLGPAPYLILNQYGNSIGLNPQSSPLLADLYRRYENEFQNFSEEIDRYLAILNTRYVIFRRDNVNEEVYKNKINREMIASMLRSERFSLVQIWGDFFLYRLNGQSFLPHIYVPRKIVKSNEVPAKILDIWPKETASAVVFGGDNPNKAESMARLAEETVNPPAIEFKKISPVKYRVVAHQAREDFLLVFNEAYHRGWKIYISKIARQQDSKTADSLTSLPADLLNSYQIPGGNEADGATREELADYVNRGLVSTLGDRNKIDFVSKNFQGTIQNDNLGNGGVAETWFKAPLGDAQTHLKVNGYANAWIVNAERFCQESGHCQTNPDGTKSLELIIEFWPQRLFYLGLIISALAMLASLRYLLVRRGQRDEEQI
ncbi:MAG: hypothetical protein AAB360_00080 [Patescibacteria group bacterium]